MSGEERRDRILQILRTSKNPVAGVQLAKQFGISRQVVVQDIALLRANGIDVIATNRGYVVQGEQSITRVFKVIHTDEEVQDELNLFVDLGGKIEDVFVYHKVYGVVCAKLNIKSRMDVRNYMKEISAGKSSLLKNVTSGYHYHTISAESVEILDEIKEELANRGYLAKLQDYEPVDFWGDQPEEE